MIYVGDCGEFVPGVVDGTLHGAADKNCASACSVTLSRSGGHALAEANRDQMITRTAAA